jgi:hypothetical protein
LESNRFPAFCGALVAGFSLLQALIFASLNAGCRKIHGEQYREHVQKLRRLARFLAALLAASLSFSLLNKASNTTKPSSAVGDQGCGSVDGGNVNRKTESKIPPNLPPLPTKATLTRQQVNTQGIALAGKSIDLTLFAVIRALDVVIQSLGLPDQRSRRVSRIFAKIATPFLFAASSATIMHAFFYTPSRLPFSYVSWIDRIAGVDSRLVEALRHARYGNFIYGKDTRIAPLLGGMCKDLGLPEEWGDPAKTIPVPCELVHQGVGPSCEKHLVVRFWRAWLQALGVYAPLQAIILLRKLSQTRAHKFRAILDAMMEAARSSAFLGTFVALFYFGVCMTRTRLGPKLFSYKTIPPQVYDSGLGIDVGCLLCGWSLLLEPARRQAELMLFVLPRAVAVWLPRRYPRDVSYYPS